MSNDNPLEEGKDWDEMSVDEKLDALRGGVSTALNRVHNQVQILNALINRIEAVNKAASENSGLVNLGGNPIVKGG